MARWLSVGFAGMADSDAGDEIVWRPPPSLFNGKRSHSRRPQRGRQGRKVDHSKPSTSREHDDDPKPTRGRQRHAQGRPNRRGRANKGQQGRPEDPGAAAQSTETVCLGGAHGLSAAPESSSEGTASRTKWWHSMQEADPITLEPLADLTYEPFGIDSTGLGVFNWFDGKVLANYLVSTNVFLNPMTNVPLTRDDCVKLDLHLIKYKLGKPCVARVFDCTMSAAKEGERGTAQDRGIRSLREEANAIMESLFTNSRLRWQGASAPGSIGRIPQHPGVWPFGHSHEEGPRFRLFDDDVGMIDGGTHSTPDDAGSAFPPLASSINATRGVFSVQGPHPEVATASPRRSWSACVQKDGAASDEGGASSSIATNARSTRSNARRIEAMHKSDTALISSLDALMQQSTGEGAEGLEGIDGSQEQVCADDSEVQGPPHIVRLPSKSLLANDVVEYCKKHMSFVEKVEELLTFFVREEATRRLVLPQMERMQRKVVHEVSGLHHVVSQAYGSEPFRRIHLLKHNKVTESATPHVLSDFAKGLIGSVESEDEDFQIDLTDVNKDCKLEEVLRYVLHLQLDAVEIGKRRPPHENTGAVLKFKTRQAFTEAQELLGAGIRGMFRVKK